MGGKRRKKVARKGGNFMMASFYNPCRTLEEFSADTKVEFLNIYLLSS
jgi:hypothetical protein